MGILEKLKRRSATESGIRDFCIQTIRFKKFLENARSLLDCFEDGREKFFGEYIFDRHYVVSVIDRVVEQLGMMVYDASVLAPESGEALFAAYDKHKLAAENLIASNGLDMNNRHSNSAAAISDRDDPEYRLLSDALRWCNGKGASAAPADQPTVMDFMKQVFFAVMAALDGPDNVAKQAVIENRGTFAAGKDLYVIDLWKDAHVLPKTNRAVSDVRSVPFRHLLMDNGREKGDAGQHSLKAGAWVAAISDDQLSLSALNPASRFRLETLASGYESSDFIFVFADRSVNLDVLLPEGFHVENSESGRFAWNLDVSAKIIGDSLMVIGRNLFG
ncbi:MAG: hypothetical protein R2860_05855 [Desulfobacterales bacterium]